jgi:hypothetical protein
MREPRPGQSARGSFLVLNRSCADLRRRIAEIFGGRGDVEVVVDRREGPRAMPGMPTPQAVRCRRRRWRDRLRAAGAELPEQAE